MEIYMDKDEALGKITIDEAEINLLKRIDSGYDTIEIINETGQIIDGNMIADYFRQIPGINKIISLEISYNSNLEDLMVIKGFPNLKSIDISGHKIKTLDGLEYFRNGCNLYINTEKNSYRNITNISQAPITKLTLWYEKKEDFDAIGTSTTIKNLELGSSPQPPFDKWRNLPIEYLKLSGGKFKEFGDTTLTKHLIKIFLINCRLLERLVGDNSRVVWMVIDGCTRLDISTIKSFNNLKTLWILKNQIEVPLSVFGALRNLESLKLVKCNLNIDILNLREAIPNLKELHIMNLKKEQLLELRRLNPEVVITN